MKAAAPRSSDPDPVSAPESTRAVAGHRLDRQTLSLLFTLALGVFVGALDLGVLGPALPALAREFHVTARDVAWTFTLYLLANVVSIPITTKLSDAYGRRPVYIGCLVVFAAGSVLAIAAPSFPVFLLARAVQAAGAGGIFPVAAAAIGDRVPPERRGAALGIIGAVWGLAAIVGPAVGGVVTRAFSWHWIFVANVPLALVVIVLARRTIPTIAARARGPLDVPGIVALTVGLLGVMVGLSRLDARGAAIPIVEVAAALTVAVVAFAALIVIERGAASPVISPQIFATRQLRVVYALEGLIGLLEGALFFIPSAVTAAQHLSADAAGGLAAIAAVVFVAVIPSAGRALDRFGSRAVLAAGTVLSAIGLWLFGVTLGSLPLTVVSLVVSGIGFGALLGAPTRYIVTNEVPSSMRGVAVGLLSVFLILGQIVGGSLAGGLVGARIDDVAGYRIAYLVFSSIAVLAALATLALASRADERKSAHA